MSEARSWPPAAVSRHGAYLCLRAVAGLASAQEPLAALTERLDLRSEFDAPGPAPGSVAFLRLVRCLPGDVADARLSEARAVVHVASDDAATVSEFLAAARLLLGGAVLGVLTGVVRARVYTGAAMHEFAYARQLPPRPGAETPSAFLLPMRKTAAWWAKSWMERQTYFLPRYDDAGRMRSEGHALAAAAGIPVLTRRTYRPPVEPPPAGEYDFLSYFECADADVGVFHDVCAALRDIERNPEWRYVREGPTWHGRRVETWRELFG